MSTQTEIYLQSLGEPKNSNSYITRACKRMYFHVCAVIYCEILIVTAHLTDISVTIRNFDVSKTEFQLIGWELGGGNVVI